MKIAYYPAMASAPRSWPRRSRSSKGSTNNSNSRKPLRRRRLEASGRPLPDATLALAQQADAVMVGATGVWKYDKLERALRPNRAFWHCVKN